jgi:hypothetical protein
MTFAVPYRSKLLDLHRPLHRRSFPSRSRRRYRAVVVDAIVAQAASPNRLLAVVIALVAVADAAVSP